MSYRQTLNRIKEMNHRKIFIIINRIQNLTSDQVKIIITKAKYQNKNHFHWRSNSYDGHD